MSAIPLAGATTAAAHGTGEEEDPLITMLRALEVYKEKTKEEEDKMMEEDKRNEEKDEEKMKKEEQDKTTPALPLASQTGLSAVVERLSALPLMEQHVQPFLLVGQGCDSHRCAHRRATGLDGRMSLLAGVSGRHAHGKHGDSHRKTEALARLERKTREAAPQRRVPCLNCFGLCGYCSFVCQSDHYPLHTYECAETLKRMASLRDGLFSMRQRQIDNANMGFMSLVGNLVNNAPRQQLLDSFFLIPFPHNPSAKFTRDHPIKRIPRVGAGAVFNQNLCLAHVYQKILERIVRQARGQGTRDEPVFMIVYPPDFGFCLLVALPLEVEERFDERQQAETEIVICPCTAHTRRTG